MKHSYKPKGVCPRKIEFELNENTVHNIVFTGGCNGNLKALGKILEGSTVEEITEMLEGNTCGRKSTSCADQLTKALQSALQEEASKRIE
ncbi:MAG: TIGR03905 family TSCPD domain-containing protein [Bacillota bacterium]|nr:TIGR03905 family TSCPD domain-containing protein [Bacillota bacterium]